MKTSASIPLITALLVPEVIEKLTSFERDFLEGMCRIGASGKMLTLTDGQEKLLVGLYFKFFLLPKIKTDGYKPKKTTSEDKGEE